MRTYQWGILLAVALLLVMWSVREHFEATASIKAPPYDYTEKLRILDMLRNADQATLLTQAEQANPALKTAQDDAQTAYTAAPTDAKKSAVDAAKKALKVKSAEIMSNEVEKFFTTKYKPATVAITRDDVETYVKALPIGTPNKPMIDSVLKFYFVGQSGVGTSATSGYADALRGLGQSFGYGMTGAATGEAPGAVVDRRQGGPPGGTSFASGPPNPDRPASTGSSQEYELIDPICPSGTSLTNVSGRWVCIEPGVDFTCPPGYSQKHAYCMTPDGVAANAQCPPGKQINSVGKCTSPAVSPSCPSGYDRVDSGYSAGRCRRPHAGGSASQPLRPDGSQMSSDPGSSMTSSAAAAPGNTTGGTSTSSYGPTARSSSKFMVWGPIGGGRGEGDGVSPSDTSKTNKYPELLGGLGSGKDKTRIDGIGLTEPSSSWQLSMSGMLPDAKSLGATEESKYLPFSRTPGDMEKIPDPYRVSQTFRQSSYSSKTDPVPFLADFSAFQK